MSTIVEFWLLVLELLKYSGIVDSAYISLLKQSPVGALVLVGTIIYFFVVFQFLYTKIKYLLIYITIANDITGWPE